MLAAALMCSVGLRAQQEMPVPLQEIRQDDDIQARFRAILDIPLAKNLSLEWSEQVRMHNNVSDVDKILSTVGLNYKVLPWLKVGASYSFVNVRDEETKLIDMNPVTDVTWQNRHMVNVDVTGSYKVGRVKLSLRERVRFNFRGDSINEYEKVNPAISLRSRLKAAYDIRQCRWEPYAYVELYTTLNAVDAVPNYKEYNVAYKQYMSRLRFSVGTEFKINNYHRLDIYYRFHMNQSYDLDYKNNKGDLKPNYTLNEKSQIIPQKPSDMGWRHEKQNCHVIGLDYKFKL